MPKNALGLMDLSSGQVARIERVKSFQVPEDGSGFIAYLLEPKPDQKKPEGGSPSASAAGGNPTVREGATSPPQKAVSSSKEAGSSPTVREGATVEASASPKPAPTSKDKKKEYGSDLVLRNTVTGAERTFNDVLDYSLSKDAKTLVYTVASKKEETNGVYVVTPQTETAPVSLLAGKGKYQKLTWDEDQTELAFISDRDDAEAKQPKFKVYLWNRGRGVVESAARNHPGTSSAASANEIVSTSSPGFRKDFVISEKATLGFSLDGGRLFL